MPAPTTIVEELLYSVKRVEATLQDGSLSVGTGYLCRIPHGENQAIIFCVTNKHVTQGAKSIRLLMHTATIGKPGPDGGQAFIELSGAIFAPHPDDSVDLCALAIAPAVTEWEKINSGKALFYRVLDEENLYTQTQLDGLDALEPVLMIGCPNGLWDERNGFPLIRRGVTASHPAVDFNGASEFALDIGVYSGSSGSPVFLFESGLIKQNKSENAFSPGLRFGLIGTLWGGPRINEKGQVQIDSVPTSKQMTAEVGVRMHIGYAVKSTKTIELFQEIKSQLGIPKNSS